VRSASRTGRRARALGLGLGLALGLSAAAQAQAPTPASPVEPAAVVAPLAALATVEVARYEVEGNTLIAPERLAAVLEPYTGRVTLSRLREAAATVQELYREDGWGGVVAFLPEQTLEGGVVRIRVVEGRLVRIDVTGQSAFSVENIRASLPALQEGSTPQVRRVDGQIQMANENPAKAVQVLLQPGVQPGELVAKVEVQELPVLRATARLDNSGGRSTGRWRAALGAQHANLFGLDHVGAIELQTAPENIDAVAVLSGSWRVPFYARAMALDIYGAVSNVDAGTVGTAAGDLSFSGRGGVFGTRLGVYLPRLGNIDQRLFAGIELREYDNECRVAGLPDGACGSAGASVSLQPASLVYTAQAAGEWRWGFSVGLHGNLALGGSNGREANFEAVRGGAPRRYALVRGSSHLSVPVEGWGHLGARFSFQLSDRPLVPGELFGIGGAGNVRGFEERELAGDSGASLSLEAVSANLGEAVTWLAGADVRALLFADAGTVSNSDDAPCQVGRTSCRMGSLGLGLRGGFGAWQLRLDIARAFTFGTTTEKGDVRAHAALLYNF
jgi:hemolysin activation/secretion protein